MPLPRTSIRAIRGAPADRARWVRWLDAEGARASLRPLKATSDVGVYEVETPGGPMVIKCWRLATLAHRAYAALRSTRGSRQWRGTQRLARLGLRGPRCHALVRGRHGDDLIEALVMDRVDGRTVLEHLAQPTLGVRAEHAVAAALARQCAVMAGAGVFNRDHKPSNLVVVSASDDGAEIAVLDAVAVRPLPRGGAGRLPPLERLVLEAIGVGAPPRRALVARFVRVWVELTGPAGINRRDARRAVWRTVSQRIAEHGDPTPTDNPLTPGVDSGRRVSAAVDSAGA